jgi:hypothetical protein
VEYQQIAAGWFVLCSEYGRPPFVGGVLWKGVRCGSGWFSCLAHCWVLRQQGRDVVGGLCGLRAVFGVWCFWFPGCMVLVRSGCPFFLVGVVGAGVCGTGLLFENYIVDASI